MTPHNRPAVMNSLPVTKGERPATLLQWMLRKHSEEVIGKPCAGKPHARFERGPQETERARHRA